MSSFSIDHRDHHHDADLRFDIYKHNPWRAPGSAPVLDACGLAGGTPWGGDVGEWGELEY